MILRLDFYRPLRNFGLSLAIVLLGAGWGATRGDADDWPQWLGPQRDGHWRETGIVREFPKDGLPVRWRVPVAHGYSGPAVANGKVFVMDYVIEEGTLSNSPSARSALKGKERIQCFDAEDGSLIWKHEYDRPYNVSYANGPRATPTVDQGKVYCLGAEGDLLCLDEESGEVVWQKNFARDFGAETPIWGFCSHPLVVGDQLFCLVGGPDQVVVAFDKQTGEKRWSALSARSPGYCPPMLIKAAGTDQLIVWHPESINSLNPKSGEVYWSIPLAPAYEMSVTAPMQHDDFLFVSGIGNVGALLKLDANQPGAEVVWRGRSDTGVYCCNSTPLIDDGMIYGVSCQKGVLRGVDLKTGDRLWESFAPVIEGQRRASHGTAFLVKNGDRTFFFNESGDLVIGTLSRDGVQEISRFHVLEPTAEVFGRTVVWSHPAFANRCMYARNDKELVCVSLAVPQP